MKILTTYKFTFALLYLSSLLFCGSNFAQSKSSSSSSFVSEDSNQKLKIESNGDIEIGNDEKSISSISRGGYLKIEKTTFGNSRSIFINNSGSGLEYEYREGGRVKPFEPDGRAWLGEILPELLNTTTLGSENRVNKLYAKGGASAVLDIIGKLKGDHVKSEYLKLLVKKNLKPSEISAAIETTISQVDSDHFQLEIYKNVSPSYFNDLNQLKRAVGSMESDHFKTELLKPIFSAKVVDGQWQKAIELINMVQSDHFKLEIAKTIAFEKLSDQELKFLVEDVVTHFQSDHFINELLKTAIDKGNMTESRSLLVLSGVNSMDSDHFKAETLKHLCGKQSSEKVKEKIREIAKSSIKSSHFLGEVMRCAA